MAKACHSSGLKVLISMKTYTRMGLVKCAIVSGVLLLCACVNETAASKYTVGEFIRAKKIPYESLTLVDEPPGKLVALRTSMYTIFIKTNSTLFSAERKWDRQLVEAAIILRTEINHSNVKDNPFGTPDATESTASF
jgi:hypothetical protein